MKKLGRLILWQRARDYVRRIQPLVIGITGSSGKTMVKDAILLALHDQKNLRAADHSFNTRIGVALTILGITPRAAAKHWFYLLTGSKIRELGGAKPDVLVLELGADEPGDIDFFARQLPFKIGIVTNIQSSHLRLFGTKDMVAHESMSLPIDLPKEGTAILNADDPLVAKMSEHLKAKAIYFGESENANVRARRIQRLPGGGLALEILVQGKLFELHLPHIIAEYQVNNVLAAIACTIALDGNINTAVKNLQQLKPPPGRVRQLTGRANSKILDDSYSATPENMISSLSILQNYPAQRRISILGDILDLGAATITQHQQIGEKAAEVSDVLVTVGEQMRDAAKAALKNASNEDNISVDLHHFDNPKDVGKWFSDFLKEGDVVLVKGSRKMRLEKVVNRLLANPEQDVDHILH